MTRESIPGTLAVTMDLPKVLHGIIFERHADPRRHPQALALGETLFRRWAYDHRKLLDKVVFLDFVVEVEVERGNDTDPGFKVVSIGWLTPATVASSAGSATPDILTRTLTPARQ